MSKRELVFTLMIIFIYISLLQFQIIKLKTEIKDLKSLDNNPIIIIEDGATVYTEHGEVTIFDKESLEIIKGGK